MSLRSQFRYLNAYDLHKLIINEYVLNKPGDTRILQRDGSKDRTDLDVIRENHKFLWDSKQPDTWEQQFAKKYYDKLFKEYCIGDLTLYKENKVALRWRTEKEVVIGKGQFICGNKKCTEEIDLRTWEVNFAYKENGERKNALVKIRLCPNCSAKLNYHSKKREIKRLNKKSSEKPKRKSSGEKDKSPAKSVNSENNIIKKGNETAETNIDLQSLEPNTSKVEDSPWESHGPAESKSRDDEMDDYLQDLLL